MHKLRLTLDELHVTTFVTAAAHDGERGTVYGNAATRVNCATFGPACPQTGASPECEITLALTCAGCESQLRCETDFCG